MVSYSRIPSQELFPTKGPVPPGQLIGRSEAIAALQSQLAAGSHQILAGPRRTGKTSICDAVIARLKKGGDYVVAVDLFEVGSLSNLAELIARGAIANRPGVKKVLPVLLRSARWVGRAAQVSATLKGEFGTEIEFAFAPSRSQKTPMQQMDYALRLLERLATADGHQLVLYLDEFQEVETPLLRFGDPDLLTKSMRSILQRSPHVTCLFAGSVEHMMKGLFAAEKRAFYQFGGFFSLDPIDETAWKAGLRKAYQRDKTTITDTALDHIIATSEGAPRATMLLAQQAHVVAVEKGIFSIDLPEVYQGIEYAMATERQPHEADVARIRALRTNALRVAQRVARGEPPYGSGIDSKQVTRALDSMRTAGIVVQERAREWRLVDPLLGRYLSAFPAV